MRKKMYVMILLAAFLAAGASFKSDAAAKYAISGGSKKVQWDYNKRTKTLIFSPNKSKDHLQERLDDLEMCKLRAQKVIYKKGVESLYTTFYPYEDGTYRPYDKLERVEITGDVNRIDNNAFCGCSRLKKVVIKKGVNYIGYEAFSGVSIKKLIIPSSVDYIGEYAFDESGLSSIKFNNGLKYIGRLAFVDTQIESVNIPNSVIYIDDLAFSECKFLKKAILPNRLNSVSLGLFYGDSQLNVIIIPDTVKTINSVAFKGTNIKNIRIPRNVEVLGTDLSEYHYDYFGTGIFDDCSQLKKITFTTKKLNRVYEGAMSGINSDVIIEVPNGLKDKYTEMFKQAGLPDGIELVEVDINDSDTDSVRLNKSKLKIKGGCKRRLYLMYTDEPDKVKWKSSNAKIIKVDSSGNVKALKTGEAKIIATYKNHKFVCKAMVTNADINNDKEELKKLIKMQRRLGDRFVSTNIHSGQYKWKKGRLIGIDWTRTEVMGVVNLNPFTYLESFDISDPWDDGYTHNLGEYKCVIMADDLMKLKYIGCGDRDLPDELIHIENSPGVVIDREEIR